MPVDIHAVVPIKRSAQAKRRLAGVLDPHARIALCRAMLDDLLVQLTKARGLTSISLVACEDEAVELAGRYVVDYLVEPDNQGHDAAVAFAARTLAERGAGCMLQLPGDIPGVQVEEIERLIFSHLSAPSFTIAPSHDWRGSNAILCSPPDLLSLRFGDDSFRAHLDRARASGIEPMVVEAPGIARDIDTLEDIRAFLATPSDTRTYHFLSSQSFSKSGFSKSGFSNPGERA